MYFFEFIKTIHGISASRDEIYKNLTNFAIETYYFNKLFNIERVGIKNLLKKIFKRF